MCEPRILPRLHLPLCATQSKAIGGRTRQTSSAHRSPGGRFLHRIPSPQPPPDNRNDLPPTFKFRKSSRRTRSAQSLITMLQSHRICQRRFFTTSTANSFLPSMVMSSRSSTLSPTSPTSRLHPVSQKILTRPLPLQTMLSKTAHGHPCCLVSAPAFWTRLLMLSNPAPMSWHPGSLSTPACLLPRQLVRHVARQRTSAPSLT